MSPMIDFSQDDLLRGRIIDPAWYRVRIDSVSEKLSKNGDSTNYVLEGKILFNADNGDKKFSDVPTPYWNFNSKAKGFMVGFFESLGITPEPGKRYELSASVGETIDVFIENDTYEGRLVNRINHKYRKPRNVEVAQ